jgi:NAD-dependent dihydropyrimidine dehydrogenase PreA subunit
MIIDPEKCVACGSCVIYCPVNAIKVTDVAKIDKDKCVECGDCFRAGVCPADAFSDPQLPWPRNVRNNFSNPLTEHPETRIPGRGTEEMKTNDIRGIFGGNILGVAMELGRPGVSQSFKDLEKVSMAVAKIPGIIFADKNPVTTNMVDTKTGKLKDDLLGERTMSAIVECEVPREQLGAMIDVLRKVEKEIDTVFSLDLIDRPMKDHTVPMQKVLDEKGVKYYRNGKFNLGLARPLVP